jgi:hypothetical protein
MVNGKSGLAMVPSCERRAGAIRYVCRFIGHIPVSGKTTVLREAGWSRAPALVLMPVEEYALVGKIVITML